MDKTECEDLYSESETEEHLNGKRDLFEWVKLQNGVSNAVLEGWIPETKQRPDIMFEYYGKKYVIEYQCSPISSEYYERHELYQTVGLYDIWICGSLKYFQVYHNGNGNGNKRLNVLEKICKKHYDPKTGLLFHLDTSIPLNVRKLFKNYEPNFISDDFDNYKPYANNFYFVKSNDINYETISVFRKKGWVSKYVYIGNNALYSCRKLSDIKIKREVQ